MVRPRQLVLSEYERASKLADLAHAIRLRREDLGLRQDELAALAGCSTKFISFVERAKPSIRIDKLLDVLAVLGLDLELKLGGGRLVTESALGLAQEETGVRSSRELARARREDR
ncbi:MAG TPA: DNA-binding protein [Micromonosporaceae bacterium]|nr:DNA-binding protein [Micromonosporaceae bacterium]